MKLIQLRYFTEVAKVQNVTQAAKNLFVAQPSVTAAIQSLEREFHVNLFYRQRKHMILTREGEYFYQRAAELLSQADELERTMKNFGGMEKTIKIGIPPMIGSFIFPPLFRAFRSSYPDISLDIQEYGSVQTAQMLLEDLIDVAIVIADDSLKNRFHVRPLLETRLVLAVSAHSPLAGKESITIDQLADLPLILMRQDSYQGNEIINRFKKAGITPNVVLRSSQIYTIKEFTRDNATGSFLFKDIVVADPEMVGIDLDPPIPITIGLIWKRNKVVYSGTSDFIDFVSRYDFQKTVGAGMSVVKGAGPDKVKKESRTKSAK
jgi:DNA-binding transcriptional LysR family regulator